MLTSAFVVTVTGVDAALLPGVGSDVGDDTVASLVNTVPSGVFARTVTLMETVALAPLARTSVSHSIVLFAPVAGVVQCQPAGIETPSKVVPGGSGSLILTALASLGPWFVTCRS